MFLGTSWSSCHIWYWNDPNFLDHMLIFESLVCCNIRGSPNIHRGHHSTSSRCDGRDISLQRLEHSLSSSFHPPYSLGLLNNNQKTPVSETSYFILTNPKLFPDPFAFRPERWLKDGQYNRSLDKYLVNFGRGSRQCLGMKFVLLFRLLDL